VITKATHVLTWYPEGHLDPASIWQLRENAEDGRVIQEWSCAPADRDPADLSEWVNEELGVPVHLSVRQDTRIKGRVFKRTVPMY
jgi:hypothetical protein